MQTTSRHIFDRTAADLSVRLGKWQCSCGAAFEDLDGLIHHVDDVVDAERESAVCTPQAQPRVGAAAPTGGAPQANHSERGPRYLRGF